MTHTHLAKIVQRNRDLQWLNDFTQRSANCEQHEADGKDIIDYSPKGSSV